MAISIDLTTFSGYPTLEEGKTYKISCQAMATGYQNSDMSATVNYTVPETTKTLPAGTYEWVTDSSGWSSWTEEFNFISNGKQYTKMSLVAGTSSIRFYYYGNSETAGRVLVSNGSQWTDEVYKTFTIIEDQTVSSSFYTWAVTNGNLEKKEPETWLLNETLDNVLRVYYGPYDSIENFATSVVNGSGAYWVIGFTSYDQNYGAIGYDQSSVAQSGADGAATLVYSVVETTGAKPTTWWVDDAYRTITFSQPVTNETLLAWLETNGTKQ